MNMIMYKCNFKMKIVCSLLGDLTDFLVSFSDRKKELLVGIYKMGYTAPSKIQETALPALLADP
jgi:superfamily II DNA/RNA helicase